MLYLQRKKKNAFLTTQIKDIEECPTFTNFTIYLSYGVLFLVGYVKEFFYPPSTKETNREVECTGETGSSGLVIETPSKRIFIFPYRSNWDPEMEAYVSPPPAFSFAWFSCSWSCVSYLVLFLCHLLHPQLYFLILFLVHSLLALLLRPHFTPFLVPFLILSYLALRCHLLLYPLSSCCS